MQDSRSNILDISKKCGTSHSDERPKSLKQTRILLLYFLQRGGLWECNYFVPIPSPQIFLLSFMILCEGCKGDMK